VVRRASDVQENLVPLIRRPSLLEHKEEENWLTQVPLEMAIKMEVVEERWLACVEFVMYVQYI